MSKSTDKLGAAMKGVGKRRIEDSLRKSATVTIRVTAAQKKSMLETARFLGVTLTEYVRGLHQICSGSLKGSKR